ncbi:POU domain, class 5, transcription factor 1.1-like [Bombina bombina]|uniref:POU domain, class 5, transcription factor 1.1-like n=1 Tax=Bombina bombina TaxID=8345 RepID=UPI00235A7B69|nr:POU domain, class 5, transcription factor 1.1-like [Bombina bombina]
MDYQKMYNQANFTSFTGPGQDGSSHFNAPGSYTGISHVQHPQTLFHFPAALKPDHGANSIGETWNNSAVMTWNHHLPHIDPSDATERLASNIGDSIKIVKEEKIEYSSKDDPGTPENKQSAPYFMTGPSYAHSWNPSFWSAIPNIASSSSNPMPGQFIAINRALPASHHYPSSVNQSPETPAEDGISGVESSRCSSTNNAINENCCSTTDIPDLLGNQEDLLSERGELISKEQVIAQTRKRKRRTNIEASARLSLEKFFMTCQKPGGQEMTHLSRELHMDKDVIRVWFCNRRQKGKRQGIVSIEESDGESYDGVQTLSPSTAGAFSLQQMLTSQGYTAAATSMTAISSMCTTPYQKN